MVPCRGVERGFLGWLLSYPSFPCRFPCTTEAGLLQFVIRFIPFHTSVSHLLFVGGFKVYQVMVLFSEWGGGGEEKLYVPFTVTYMRSMILSYLVAQFTHSLKI